MALEQIPSDIKEKVQHQFGAYCGKVLKGTAIDYHRQMSTKILYEKSFSDLSPRELEQFYTIDEYQSDNYLFKALEYDVEVRSDLLCEVLQLLSQRKRDVILLSFFIGMSDTEIAKELCLVNSTIHKHKKSALNLMKNELIKRGMEE